MPLLKSIIAKITLIVLTVFSASAIVAQTTTASPQPETSGYNQLAILLVILIIVLAFVIWGMGQVLTALGRQVLDKSKKVEKILSIGLIILWSTLPDSLFAQDAANTVTVAIEPNYGGLSAVAYYALLTVIAVEVVLILFMAFSIRRLYIELLPQKIKPQSDASKFSVWWKKMDQRLFTKAVSVEKEEDIILDHEYDGIRELDNSLPPWWKYGFYITIAVAFIYILNYHVLGLGKNPIQEYNAEMEKAKIAKEIFDANNKDKVDENNITMADAAGIKTGQSLFEANCVACHLKDGGGSVGPNLTDDYWLHKGSLNDIYHTIKNGYPDKGMQAWSGTFTPKEISYIASFVKSLKGTKPATPKEQQGEFYVDSSSGADSSAGAKPDSSAVNK